MSVRVKIKAKDRATIRWNNPMEREWFFRGLTNLRDSNPGPIQLSVKDGDNHEIHYPEQAARIVNPKPIEGPRPTPITTGPMAKKTKDVPAPPTNPKLSQDPTTMKPIDYRNKIEEE